MSDLTTLPGTIPGLLRRGSPIVCQTRPWGGWRGIYFGGAVGVAIVRSDEDDHVFIDAVPSELHLDLTDATGRAHAAWWLALREVPRRYHLDPAAVSWSRAPAQAACGWALHWLARATTGGGSLTGSWWTGSHDSPVPPDLLADIGANDLRLLPDGSRWVDAEALRRVVLHVAGVPA